MLADLIQQLLAFFKSYLPYLIYVGAIGNLGRFPLRPKIHSRNFPAAKNPSTLKYVNSGDPLAFCPEISHVSRVFKLSLLEFYLDPTINCDSLIHDSRFFPRHGRSRKSLTSFVVVNLPNLIITRPLPSPDNYDPCPYDYEVRMLL